MYGRVEKSKEKSSKAVANAVTQKKSNGKQGVGFVDNRPQTTIQRMLTSNNSKKSSKAHVIQRAFTERRVNNTIATRAAIKGHRQTESKWNWTGLKKNFAIDLDNTGTYGFSDEGGHSERNLLGYMMIGGRVAGTDVNIHTERETCISCYNYLKGLHDNQAGTAGAFDMNISYTVAYPDSGRSRQNLYDYYRSKTNTNDI